MLPTTYDALKAVLRADPSICATERNQLLATLRNGQVKNPSAESTPVEPRLLRRAEVARGLSRSVRMVDKLAASGLLKRRKLPGRIRASGFLATDVYRLISESNS